MVFWGWTLFLYAAVMSCWLSVPFSAVNVIENISSWDSSLDTCLYQEHPGPRFPSLLGATGYWPQPIQQNPLLGRKMRNHQSSRFKGQGWSFKTHSQNRQIKWKCISSDFLCHNNPKRYVFPMCSHACVIRWSCYLTCTGLRTSKKQTCVMLLTSWVYLLPQHSQV